MQKSEGPQHGLGSNRISIVMEDCFHLCKACSRHSQLVSEGVRERARGGKRVENLKIHILSLFCWHLCFCICCILISSNKVPLGKHSALPQMVSTFSGDATVAPTLALCKHLYKYKDRYKYKYKYKYKLGCTLQTKIHTACRPMRGDVGRKHNDGTVLRCFVNIVIQLKNTKTGFNKKDT